MTRFLIATFSLLVFMANQSFAAICAEACQQASMKLHSGVVKGKAEGHNCHRDNKKQPIQSESTPDCGMTLCAQDAVQPEISISQVKDNSSVKKLLIRGETVVPDLSSPLQIVLLNYSTTPPPQKIRLHLRLRRLVI